MSQYCSVFALCFAAMAAMCSVACLSIAFSTDNWQHISVDRAFLRAQLPLQEDHRLLKHFEEDFEYFDRVQGMFRVCFPHEEKPPYDNLYLNPVEEWCANIDYYVKLLEYGLLPARLTSHAEIWFHLARSSIAAFCLYFMWMGIGCVTGLLGCWKASGDHLISTAIVILLASMSGGAGMGLWHWAKFYELEKVHDERLGFFLSWPEILQNSTAFTLGWSYIIAWIGVGLAMVASVLFMGSAVCFKIEFRELEQREMMLRLQMAYPTHSILKQPNGSSIPPTPMSRRSSMYSQHYFPVGYPIQDDILNDTRTLQYKNVVKELEDSKV